MFINISQCQKPFKVGIIRWKLSSDGDIIYRYNFIKLKIMNKKIIYAVLVAITMFLLVYFYFFGQGNDVYEYVVVDVRDIVQEVSVTGKVKPISSASLAFDRVGRISKFNVEVGSRVSVGETLASLDSAELVASLLQSEANVRVQEAKLDELKRGTRVEDIQVSQAQVDSATVALADAKRGLIEKINDAYTKSDDAIRSRIDRMFSNPKSSHPELIFVASDTSLSDQIEFERFIIEGLLNDWGKSLISLSVSSDLDKYVLGVSENLEKIKYFLDKVSTAVSGLVANSSLTQTTLDTYKTETATARTNINSSISAVNTANEKLRTERSDLNIAEQQLTLKKSGTPEEQLRAQEAVLEEARANVSNIRAQLGKTVLKSPIAGIVTKKDFEVGEIVSANTPVLYIISDNKFEIEANVSEADIAKVNIGDSARVTLDAYGSDIIFPSIVTKIDPAETMIEGVATYKTTFNFLDNDNRIKSGMTANIDIMTDKKEGVLAVPQRAVSSRNGDRFVMLYVGKDVPEEKKITTGLRGSDGFIEVLSGLVIRDKIISLAE
ncbi:MAG: RND family efflux transporter MFP subunit [Parcubacteria group bacterium GW2011_GWF2_38_76]|nr:MAG: RND family efflux transporter MFP subunit [Parcubacteria group bacterium GW2011_GWF2_38_76]HBM45627.1 hypothetical protein [Patescibacteria group bacterium]